MNPKYVINNYWRNNGAVGRRIQRRQYQHQYSSSCRSRRNNNWVEYHCFGYPGYESGATIEHQLNDGGGIAALDVQINDDDWQDWAGWASYVMSNDNTAPLWSLMYQIFVANSPRIEPLICLISLLRSLSITTNSAALNFSTWKVYRWRFLH